MNLKALLEQQGQLQKKLSTATNERASKTNEMRDILNKESVSDEDQQKYDALAAEVQNMDKNIDRYKLALDDLKADISNARETQGNAPANHFQFSDPGTEPTNEAKELGSYRIVKALRDSMQNGRIDGFELEMHQEAMKEAREAGVSLGNATFHIPQKVLNAGRKGSKMNENHMRKVFNALTATGGDPAGEEGGFTVEEEIVSLIDILRAHIPFIDSMRGSGDGLGATFWGDVVGNLSFPKPTEDSTEIERRNENQASQELSPEFGTVKLSPRRFPGHIELSEQLMLQSSVDIENWTRNYLMYKVAKGVNIDIIEYLLDLAGTNPIVLGDNGGALTWADIVKMETLVEDNDVAEIEPRMAYFTNARVKGLLKTTPVETGTSDFIWDRRENTVNTYPAVISSLVPKNLEKGNSGETLSAAIFANWSQLYLAQWGGMSLLVNPYSKDREGLTRINVTTFFDRAVAHAEGFSVCKEVVTANS